MGACFWNFFDVLGLNQLNGATAISNIVAKQDA
jgi:hypothetical protein